MFLCAYPSLMNSGCAQDKQPRPGCVEQHLPSHESIALLITTCEWNRCHEQTIRIHNWLYAGIQSESVFVVSCFSCRNISSTSLTIGLGQSRAIEVKFADYNHMDISTSQQSISNTTMRVTPLSHDGLPLMALSAPNPVPRVMFENVVATANGHRHT
jgi:hypothetical protein